MSRLRTTTDVFRTLDGKPIDERARAELRAYVTTAKQIMRRARRWQLVYLISFGLAWLMIGAVIPFLVTDQEAVAVFLAGTGGALTALYTHARRRAGDHLTELRDAGWVDKRERRGSDHER